MELTIPLAAHVGPNAKYMLPQTSSQEEGCTWEK